MGPSSTSTSLKSLALGLTIYIPCALAQFGNPFGGNGQQRPPTTGSQPPFARPATNGTGNYTLTTDDKCDCFRTNTSSGNYFAHHHFIDFRSLGEHVRVPNVLADVASNTNAQPAANFFETGNWNKFWSIQNWNNDKLMKQNNSDVSGSDATLLMVNSPNNIYIERNTDPGANSQTYMTMRTARLPNFQTSAEFESVSLGYRFLSIRMYARTRGAPGAITAMFTYRGAPSLDKVQEADLEIRTNDPDTRVQFTNQPSWNKDGDIPAATRNVSMPSRLKWSDWAHYRMDWTPGATSWYVNGQLASTITFQAPRDASQVMFNTWSDGGTWSGTMPLKQEAYQQIQWIEMVFNNTDPGFAPKPGQCNAMCSIDDTPTVGTPVFVSGAANAGQSGQRPGGQTPQQPPSGQRPGGQQPQQPPSGQRPGGTNQPPSGQRPGTQQPPSGQRPGTQQPPSGQRPGGQQPQQPPSGQRPGGTGTQQPPAPGGNQGGNNSPPAQPPAQSPAPGSGSGTGSTGAACAVAKYGQCGGKNWKGNGGQNCGSFACAAGSTCRTQNDYYAQCL